MSFLAPALMALGAAIAVPLVLHLFQRHQGPTLVFPALRYLRRAEREHARRIRLRQLLLLALRVAALVLIALAAARPFLAGGDAVHEPTAAVLVLDNSLSSGLVVGDRRVLDILEERALETLAAAGAGDRFWLLRAGRADQPAVTGDPETLAQAVRATTVSPGSGDVDAALRRAAAILAAGAEDRAAEIHLLGDMQRSGFRHGTAPAASPPVVAWTDAPPEPGNRSVRGVEIGGGLPPRAGERSTVAVEVAGPPGDSVSVRLLLNGRVLGAGTAMAGDAAVLRLPAGPPGLVSGRVEIDPDALHGDDSRYFTTRVVPPPAVALAGRAAFVEDALDVLVDAGRVTRARAATADVLIAPGAVGSNALRDGRALVALPPESPLELAATNRRLAAAGVPWRLEASALEGEARFDTGDDTDPLLRSLADVRLRTVYGLVAESAAAARDSVLLRLRGGDAWAVRGRTAAGTPYVVVASPLTAEASTAPVSAAMLPLVDRMITAWTAVAQLRRSAAPGDRVTLPGQAGSVERPDGRRTAVEGGADYVVPSLAGIYHVLAGTDTLDAFAVNPAPSESDLSRLDEEGLTRALAGWEVITAGDPAEWQRRIYRRRRGREVWWPLLVAALALLVVESAVGASGRGRSRATEPPEPGHGRRPASSAGAGMPAGRV